jgi:hypothetical protein
METTRCETDRHATHPELCPVCASQLVEPVAWTQSDTGSWRLELRCPECEAERTVVLGAEAVHAYNVLLYDAADDVAAAMERLRASWAADVAAEDERFLEAVRADRILPVDF